MRVLTVRDLKNECDRLCLKGLGGKQILISDDDEGNGFHSLYYGICCDLDSIQQYKDYGMFHDDNNVEDVVVLG